MGVNPCNRGQARGDADWRNRQEGEVAINTLLDVKQRVRSLIGDPDGDFATDAYLLPLINQSYDQILNSLAGTCSPYITQLQVATNLPAGTADLTERQKPNQPFYGLVNPLDIEVKQTGNAELQYFMGRRVDILPNSSNFAAGQPSTLWNPQFCWEWRSYIIYITPLSFAFDIRIRGEFRPPALAKDTDPLALHPLMVAALSYATAALVGGERINASYVQNYGDQAVKTLDDIAAELVRQQQGTSSRVGKMNNRGRGGRRGWYQ